MKEVTLGQTITNLKIKPGDDIIVFTEARAFHGKLIKVRTANLAISMEITMKLDKNEVIEVEIASDSIIGIGKTKNEYFQIVPDSKINDDLKSFNEV